MQSDSIRGYMIKFTQLLFATILLIQSSSAFATLITTDLTDDTYITVNGLDWTWASPVNSEIFGLNELMAPSFHGWRFATNEELTFLKTSLTLADFTRDDGTYIHSASYWNTFYTDINTLNFIDDAVSSNWVAESAFNSYFETFYVREAQTKPVPEPTNIAIFGIGLIALAFRKKFK